MGPSEAAETLYHLLAAIDTRPQDGGDRRRGNLELATGPGSLQGASSASCSRTTTFCYALHPRDIVCLWPGRSEPRDIKTAVGGGAPTGIQSSCVEEVFRFPSANSNAAAIARAIIHRPALILADEPTGNLDSKSSAGVMKALSDLNGQSGATILMVTHDAFAASFCGRILFIRDGRIHSQIRRVGSRESFYQDILSNLRAQGGDSLDASQAQSQ